MEVSAGAPRIGDYELLGKLGEGGMGTVYKARQVSLDRVVALKILPPKAAEDNEYLQRFFREARATARLNHPNIVKGITVGTVDGYHVFAMEYVEGTNLKKRIRQQGRLTEDEVIVIGAAAASALAHAHSAGIIHRDVKPENILMDAQGTPKLADLGLVSMYGDGSLTQEGCAVGTPHYMAPEQVRGEKDIDGRADIYSLGCTLYHAATGSTPFDGATPAVLMTKHLNDKMTHPQSLSPDLSDDFCLVLEHMLARKREDRYSSMYLAAMDLQALLDGEPIRCGPVAANKSNFQSSGRRSVPVSRPKMQRAAAARRPEAARTGLLDNPHYRWLVLGGIGLASLIVTVLLLQKLGMTPEAAPTQPGKPAQTAETRKPAPVTPPPPLPQPTPPPAVPTPTPPVPAPDPAPENIAATSPTVALFNGKDLTNWRETRPRWTVERGVLVGSGVNENAYLSMRGSLPSDCELSMTANWRGSFHISIGVSGIRGSDIFKYDGRIATLYRYWSETDGAEPPFASAPAVDSAKFREWRIVIARSKITVYLDGALLLTTDKGLAANGASRELGLFVHRGAELRIKDLHVHDLSKAK